MKEKREVLQCWKLRRLEYVCGFFWPGLQRESHLWFYEMPECQAWWTGIWIWWLCCSSRDHRLLLPIQALQFTCLTSVWPSVGSNPFSSRVVPFRALQYFLLNQEGDLKVWQGSPTLLHLWQKWPPWHLAPGRNVAAPSVFPSGLYPHHLLPITRCFKQQIEAAPMLSV